MYLSVCVCVCRCPTLGWSALASLFHLHRVCFDLAAYKRLRQRTWLVCRPCQMGSLYFFLLLFVGLVYETARAKPFGQLLDYDIWQWLLASLHAAAAVLCIWYAHNKAAITTTTPTACNYAKLCRNAKHCRHWCWDSFVVFSFVARFAALKQTDSSASSYSARSHRGPKRFKEVHRGPLV